MAKGLVNESSLNSIGTAINVLNGTEGTYAPSEMGEAIIDAIPTETASGNPIHITDAAAYPAASVVTTLEPIQEGSGDPSPENVRPITGHTGVELKHSGVDTSIYETHSITFPQAQSPVYGGEVDWTNGFLRVTKVKKAILTNVAYSHTTDWNDTCYMINAFFANGVLISGYSTIADIICDVAEVKTPSDLASRDSLNIGVGQSSNNLFMNFGMDAETLKQYISDNGVNIVYELAEPLEIPLTPEVITLLKGENNIWTDSGTSEIEYKVDLNSYIQKLIDEASAQASALSMSPLSLGRSAAVSTDGESEEAEELPVEDVKSVDVAEDEPAELPVEEDTKSKPIESEIRVKEPDTLEKEGGDTV